MSEETYLIFKGGTIGMKYENAKQYVMILKEWLPKEASIAIAVEGIYTYYSAGIHDIGIEIGKATQKGDIAFEVANEKQKVERYIEDSNYRAPYFGIGYPITLADQDATVIIILPPAHAATQKETVDFLTGKNDKCWCPVPVEEIAYIESLQKKTLFYNTDETFQSIYTLKELAHLLPNQFLRIHRSYIVNIKEIMEISRDFSSNILITLKNGTILPVSQSYARIVRKTLGF